MATLKKHTVRIKKSMQKNRKNARFSAVDMDVTCRIIFANTVEIRDISLDGISLKSDKRFEINREYQMKIECEDGFDLLDRIKADKELKRIPVCILTTSKPEADIEKAKELKADYYLIKPFDLEVFETTFSGIIHGLPVLINMVKS